MFGRKQYYNLGWLVRIKKRVGAAQVGTVGYVYKSDNERDWVIDRNGNDLGVFYANEREDFLDYIEDSGVIYTFTSKSQLLQDYSSGFFDMVWRA